MPKKQTSRSNQASSSNIDEPAQIPTQEPTQHVTLYNLLEVEPNATTEQIVCLFSNRKNNIASLSLSTTLTRTKEIPQLAKNSRNSKKLTTSSSTMKKGKSTTKQVTIQQRRTSWRKL
jgi:hypothetical protein